MGGGENDRCGILIERSPILKKLKAMYATIKYIIIL